MNASVAEGTGETGGGGEFGPWNPGLVSQIPRQFRHLSTVLRPQNISNDTAEIFELADFTGLGATELARFRPERLAVHELLVRVMADFSVPDGPNYEDLGISFREICSAILNDFIAPNFEAVRQCHAELDAAATAIIERELAEHLFAAAPAAPAHPKRRGLLGLLGLAAPAKAVPVGEGDATARATRAIAHWSEVAGRGGELVEGACADALARVVTALVSRHGRPVGGRDIIVKLAGTLVSNRYGSDVVGRAIEPFIAEAVRAHGYRVLPAQQKPLVMNAKGASASGKSTTRPQQRALSERLDVDWADFALISPDIWRKFLLDYDSLGDAWKYAGAFTSQELEIIDLKLDRYMAAKSASGRMTHLLIDRFRFDSFSVDQDETSSLLTRFGDLIFMFFMITPPHMTVERAWKRGLKFGRYKSVDDLLFHNVEAFTGMPRLFFSWAGMTKKRVHYEFLDNSVGDGELPRTVAFGWNGAMTVLDVSCLLDIDRYRTINIDAATPDEVYAAPGGRKQPGAEFLRQCARNLEAINFADQDTGRVYARMERGQWVWWDDARVGAAMGGADTKECLMALGWENRPDAPDPGRAPEGLMDERRFTVGDWGEAGPA